MTKQSKATRDFLLRGLPIELTDKMKVAASLHRKAMREYMIEVLAAHIKELERKGITLALPKMK
jgi:plasmid stability protein